MDNRPEFCDNASMPKRSSKNQTIGVDQSSVAAAGGGANGSAEPAPSAPAESSGKNPAAVALGRLGGKKGGLARAKKLTAEQRREIAKKAAQARWAKKKT